MSTLYSPQFQSLYHFFEALAKAAKVRPPAESDSYRLEVFRAFKTVWAGLPDGDRGGFLQHAGVLLENIDRLRDTLEAQQAEERRLVLEFAAESESLLISGQLLPVQDFCGLAGLSEQEFETRIGARKIFKLWRYTKKHEVQYFVPYFFIDPAYNGTYIELVSVALGDSNEFAAYRFFTSPCEHIDGMTPLEAIGENDFGDVLLAVEKFQAERI